MPTLVTRDRYFVSAMEIVTTEGFDNLRIGKLYASVGVTSGSFYHYFGSWKGFVDRLFEYWEAQQNDRLTTLATVSGDAVARTGALTEFALGVPHDTEAAIRAWSHTGSTVGVVQERVDRRREKAILSVVSAVVTAVVTDPARARVLTMMGMMGMSIIGFQQLRSPVEEREMCQMLDEYQRTVLAHSDDGCSPEPDRPRRQT
ncbi:TetR/AcrR family transcriptional regulator [Protofrankia symbiont of Coriaria ruscifolia]|uniref:TetR/AcrR family transcriptional regulator n=1 Tax=Protofrankia symbiont of Coriaria ruscifolia TaxID=1306542 RepID=UPI0010412BA1|nr:TetR/AcrR family transcriptional regulator [Protofrankia symbiont of Coriaria ruscifolia]